MMELLYAMHGIELTPEQLAIVRVIDRTPDEPAVEMGELLARLALTHPHPRAAEFAAAFRDVDRGDEKSSQIRLSAVVDQWAAFVDRLARKS